MGGGGGATSLLLRCTAVLIQHWGGGGLMLLSAPLGGLRLQGQLWMTGEKPIKMLEIRACMSPEAIRIFISNKTRQSTGLPLHKGMKGCCCSR